MKMKTFFNELKTYRMSREEKSRIRIALISLSQSKVPHVSPNHTNPNQYRKPIKSPYGAWSFGFNFRAVGIAVLALLVASTGVSFAAENTLPGDLLYGVKVNVSEEVRGALITDSTAKMDWEKDRVVRRVVETETLIKTNQFTPERKIQAEAALKTQIETFATAAAETSVTHPNAVIAATAELEPALKVHQDIITELTANTDNTSTPAETETILTTVAAGIAATSAQEIVAIQSTSEKAPEALLELTDEKISDAADAIETSTIVAIDVKVDESTDSIATDKTDESQTTEKSDEIPGDQTEKNIAAGEAKLKVDIAPDETKKEAAKEAVSDITPLRSDIALDVAPMAATMSVIAPSPKPQEVLANAKAKLKQAKVLREKGEYKEALTLAQDAYKDIVALKLQAKIGNKIKSQENSKVESKADTPLGEVKGAQTDNVQTDTKTGVKTDTKINDTPAEKTTGTEKTDVETKTDISAQVLPVISPMPPIKR